MAKKKIKPIRTTPKQPTVRDAQELHDIGHMLQDGEYKDALKELKDFTERRPQIIDGWEMMVEAANELGDAFHVWYANRRLLELSPHEPDYVYNAAVSSLNNGLLFSASHHITMYQKRWPDGDQIKQINDMVAFIQPYIEDARAETPEVKDAPDEHIMLFDESQVFVSYGEAAEGRVLAQKVARLLPNFASPRNNVILSYMVEGKFNRALSEARKVIADFPGNVHAICNLAQVLIRLGDPEADTLLEQVRDLQPIKDDDWSKMMETFAHAGWDEDVLRVYERASIDDQPLMMTYMAGVAYARTGDLAKAQKLWREVLMDDDAGLLGEMAQTHMLDLPLPEGDRNGPWYFPFHQIVPRPWIEKMDKVARHAIQTDKSLSHEIQRVLDATPGFTQVLSISLDRGDREGRQLALQFAEMVPVPGLVEFALSTKGDDQARMRAANIAANHGLLDRNEPVVLYNSGKPTEQYLVNFNITDEIDHDDAHQIHFDAVLDLLDDEMYGDALDIVEEVLADHPDTDPFRMMKAALLVVIGEYDDSEAYMAEVARSHPDHLLATLHQMHQEPDSEKRQDLLQPVMAREEMHYLEMVLFAMTQIRIGVRDRNGDLARAWLQMLNSVMPEAILPSLDAQVEAL